jgi:outer membrane immunogenic protein
MNKTFAIAALSAGLCLPTASMAADVYTVSGAKDAPYYAPVWTGLYLGFNAGYGFSTSSDSLTDYEYTAGLRAEGGFGGAQIGYNWQVNPRWVAGIEADFQASAINDRNVLVYADSNVEYTHRLDSFGTVRGRLGMSAGNALIFATGGFAYGSVHKAYAYESNDFYTFKGVATGYTLGGGIEYKITPAWSVKAEYLYLDLGTNATSQSGDVWTQTDNRDTYHVFRAGANFHLNGDYVPLSAPLK